jgi:hypothetical protein
MYLNFENWTGDSAACLCDCNKDRPSRSKKNAGSCPEMYPGQLPASMHLNADPRYLICCLIFFDNNCVFFTNFYTAFTAHALFRIDRN